jgi:hypothetical protein
MKDREEQQIKGTRQQSNDECKDHARNAASCPPASDPPNVRIALPDHLLLSASYLKNQKPETHQ